MTSAAEKRLEMALEAAQLGTWTWDMSSGTTEWDIRLEELHGLAPGGFGGTFEDWVAAMHPEDRAQCLVAVEHALQEPGPYGLLHRTIWHDGSVHWIECRGTVLLDDAGTPMGTTGIALDVTERMLRETAIADELAANHRIVETLQEALLPAALPSVPGVAVASRYVTSAVDTEIGGDWYAVVPLPGNRLGIGIGDVAGHGLPAVADMAGARFSLRALALTDFSPEAVLERLDDVVRVFGNDTMITALYGVLDPGAERWSFASAGHPPAILRLPDRTTITLDYPHGPPLGVGTSSHERHDVLFAPGSTLVLYTDGLVEQRRESIASGIQRLESACRAGPDDPEALCDFLLEEMLKDAPNEDDVAIFVVSSARNGSM